MKDTKKMTRSEIDAEYRRIVEENKSNNRISGHAAHAANRKSKRSTR